MKRSLRLSRDERQPTPPWPSVPDPRGEMALAQRLARTQITDVQGNPVPFTITINGRATASSGDGL